LLRLGLSFSCTPDIFKENRNMNLEGIARRSILKTLAAVPAAALIQLVPLQAAETAHNAVNEVKAAAGADYAPKFFNPHEYATLRTLCQKIIPSDNRSGGALEAGAPEFIDLLTSENEDYQRRLGGGIMWLDAACRKRFDKAYVECSPSEQKAMLDAIAYRANGEKDPSLAPGTSFFSFLRELTADGYFTSKIGIEYLGYVGNKYLLEFPGCPPVPDL
jgi:gluconate 2-dehydrogenase gamma chain